MPIEMNYLAQFGGPLIKRKKPAKWRGGGGGAFFAEVQVAYAKFGLCKVRYLAGSPTQRNQQRRDATGHATDGEKTRPKPHRSERQYEWTRNYALILSYRSPVAVVPIGISGVRAGGGAR